MGALWTMPAVLSCLSACKSEQNQLQPHLVVSSCTPNKYTVSACTESFSQTKPNWSVQAFLVWLLCIQNSQLYVQTVGGCLVMPKPNGQAVSYLLKCCSAFPTARRVFASWGQEIEWSNVKVSSNEAAAQDVCACFFPSI